MLKNFAHFFCRYTCFARRNSVIVQGNWRKFGTVMILFVILTTRGDTLLSRLCIPVCDLKSCKWLPVKLWELEPFMTVVKLLKEREIIIVGYPDLCSVHSAFHESTFIGSSTSVGWRQIKREYPQIHVHVQLNNISTSTHHILTMWHV